MNSSKEPATSPQEPASAPISQAAIRKGESPRSMADIEKGLPTPAGQTNIPSKLAADKSQYQSTFRSNVDPACDPSKPPESPADQSSTPTTPSLPPIRNLSFLDRFLVLWIILAMAIGILLGAFVPSTGPTLNRGTFVGVSIPIAVGLLVMMYPILIKGTLAPGKT